jgi:hypothetical protein
MRYLLPWSLVAALIEGQFGAIVVSRSFGGDELLIAIATATPMASLMFSLVWGPVCTGRPKVRLSTMLCAGIVLCTGAVFAIPATHAGAIWFIAQTTAAQILLAGVITVRSAMWRSNYPQSERGRITARLQGVREVVTVAGSMCAAAWCGIDGRAYAYVYPLAALMGAVGIIFLTRIHVRSQRSENRLVRDAWRESGPVARRAWSGAAGMVAILHRDRRFARYMVAQFLMGVANLLPLAAVTKIVTQDIPIGDAWAYWVSVALLVAMPKLCLMGTITRWGRLFDRIGVVRFRVVNMVCALCALSLTLVAVAMLEEEWGMHGSGVVWVVALLSLRGVFYGLTMAGGKLAWSLGHLHFAESAESESYMGIHVSLTGLRGLFAPPLGMWLWSLIGWKLWLVAITIGLAALIMFAQMAARERGDQANVE